MNLLLIRSSTQSSLRHTVAIFTDYCKSIFGARTNNILLLIQGADITGLTWGDYYCGGWACEAISLQAGLLL